MTTKIKPQWKITRDRINTQPGDTNRVGTKGPQGYDPALESQMTERWRCKDDDGEIYYEGIATPDSDFAPLDDFCQPDAGCTSIEYWNRETKKWEGL